jgi:hypothetical protein
MPLESFLIAGRQMMWPGHDIDHASFTKSARAKMNAASI